MSDDSQPQSTEHLQQQSMSDLCRAALDSAMADLERRWRAGTPIKVESYLESQPELRSNQEAALDLIYKEILARSDAGERPELDEYSRRFPDLAEALRPIFEVHHALESSENITPHHSHQQPTLRVPVEVQATKPEVAGYQILERLGHGGMGVVYKARQKNLGRIVALKMILAGPHASPEELARFRRAAEVVAKLAHPNIVQIHEVGEHDGRPFLSLEFVEGGGLDKKLAGAPMPAREAAQLVETLARAIHHANLQGVVHRDLKPANVLLSAGGTPKITDFGLARQGAGSGETRSGDILGTPSYMSPEQAAGRNSEIGPATDVYALGATLYELLTGRPPFRADNAIETLRQVVDQEPVSPSQLQPSMPRDLVTVCLKCLQKSPIKRYASAEALADDLRRFLDGRPIQARQTPTWERTLKWARRRPALAGLYALAIVAAVVLGLYTIWLRDALDETEHQRSAAQKAQKDAEAAAEERRLQLVRARLDDGSRLLDEGDWFAALLPFADALQLDQKDTKRAEIHRTRLSAILRQCPRLVQFWPQEADVVHAEFTADGRRVLTASGKTARLIDTDTGKDAAPPMIHDQTISSVTLSPDGLRIATAADDHTVQIWDAATSRRIGEPLALQEPIVNVAFAADVDRIITATRNIAYQVTIQAWQVSSGKPINKPLTTPTGPLSSVAFSADGRLAATAHLVNTKAGDHPALTVWDVGSGKAVFDARNVPGSFMQIRFSPNGGRVAAANADGTVRAWDCTTGKETAHVRQGAPVHHLAFSPDGQRLATGGLDGVAHIWEAGTGKLLVTLRHGMAFTHAVNYVAFSPDGLFAVTAGADNTARVWDATTGMATAPPLRHGDKVTRATFGRDGRLVLTASADRAVRVWDLATGRLATPPLEHEDAVAHASFDRDGKRAVTAGADRIARVWDVASGRTQGPPLVHPHKLRYAAFNADGHVVTTGENNVGFVGDATVWETSGKLRFRRTTAQKILGVPDTDHTVRRAWFSADGRWLVAVDRAGAAQIWNVATGEPTSGVLDVGSAVTGVSFSADGRHVLTETFLPEFTVRALQLSGEQARTLGNLIQILPRSNTVKVWEVSGGKCVASIGPWSDGTSLSFRRAAFNSDGKTLLVVSDGEARLWDITEGRVVRRFRKPGAGVANAALSPDGRILVTTTDDQTAQLWNAANGELVSTPVQFRSGGQFWPPRFSRDGRFLVTSSWKTGVRIWDAATGDPITPPLDHVTSVESVEFSADGRLLVTAADRAARVWSLSAEDRSADDWLRLAHLLSCSRMHPQGGRPVPLLPDELRTAWEELRVKASNSFAIAPKDAITWHAEAARVCEKLNRWNAALPHLEFLANHDPERLELHARRGRAYADVGQWKNAAADFEKAASLDKDKHRHWFRHALVRLHLGERDAHRRVCAEMLDRFESSKDLFGAQQAAWAGSLAPAPAKDAARMVLAAERAALGSPENHARLLTLGAALFRAGRHEDAVRKLDYAIKVWGKDDTVWDWLFLSMAHHHLGASEQAKANFDRAAKWIDQRQVKGVDGTITSTLFWSDRLELTLLRREAEGYLGKTPDK